MEVVTALLQIASLGFLLPAALLLDAPECRLARPAQIAATILALVSIWIRGGSPNTGYRVINIILTSIILLQFALGWWKSQSLTRPANAKVMSLIDLVHRVMHAGFLFFSWLQMTCGIPADLGLLLVHGDMLAHALPSFLIICQARLWLESAMSGGGGSGGCRSPEYYDSLCMAAISGSIIPFAVFAEQLYLPHKAGLGFSVHTFILLMPLAASGPGLWLSTSDDGRPRRNLVPALTWVFTGHLMTVHRQSTLFGETVHLCFGYVLMAAGATRGLEALLVPLSPPTQVEKPPQTGISYEHIRYLPPLLQVIAGFLILGASADMLRNFENTGIMPASYLGLLESCGFIYFLFLAVLTRQSSLRKSSKGGLKEHQYTRVSHGNSSC